MRPLLALLTPLLALSAVETPAELPDEQGRFEPPYGMAPDGRIPAVVLPDDIDRPERWRYVPEGRLLRGDPLERFLVSTFIAPIVFAEEDIGFGGGIALTDIDFRNQRRREFLGLFATYTSEGQQRYSAVWRRWLHHRELPDGGIAMEERSFLNAAASYERTLTRRFFGFGAESGEDDETSYTDELVLAELGYQRAWPAPGDDLIWRAGLRAQRHNLARGRVSAVPDTGERHPSLIDEADGYAGLTLLGRLAWDTRDSQHAPYRGGHLALDLEAVPLQRDFAPGAILRLEGSWIQPVPGLFHRGGDGDEEHPPTDVLALGAFVADSAGELPFFRLPSLGGRDTLRGHIANRFTDEAAWHASAEYRLWFLPRGFGLGRFRVERLGTVLFGDLGSVAAGLEDLPEADIHWSAGTGLRVSLERQAQFRFDLGFSAEDTTFTIAYGQAF